MKIDVVDLGKKKVGEIDLSDDVWKAEVHETLLHEVVQAQLASRRAGSASTKERSAVAGSTKKIYRQKGTGRARHGGIRSPIFAGGGKAHGPVPRSYAQRPSRKVRQAALRSALSLFARDGKLVVVDGFPLKEIKTKLLAGILDGFGARSSVLVDDRSNEKLRLSSRNLESHLFLSPEGVNVYDLLRHQTLIVTKDAARALEARCLSTRGAERAEGGAS